MKTRYETLYTEFEEMKNDFWYSGTHVMGYEFQAKVYPGSELGFGINSGNVAKLTIWDFDGNEVYNFDRGLDFCEIDESILLQIVEDLDSIK